MNLALCNLALYPAVKLIGQVQPTHAFTESRAWNTVYLGKQFSEFRRQGIISSVTMAAQLGCTVYGAGCDCCHSFC